MIYQVTKVIQVNSSNELSSESHGHHKSESSLDNGHFWLENGKTGHKMRTHDHRTLQPL